MTFIAKILKKIFTMHDPSKEWTKVHRVEYQEEDTKCDLCEFKSNCEPYLLNCKTLGDTRTHFINNPRHICPLDIREYFTTYPEASKTIFDIMSENDISEQYKTCGRCIHDSESSDIVGSTCYMCKRNPDDHRIDWFEKKKEEN